MKKVIYQIGSKNEWLLLSGRFAAKYELVFVLTLENAISWRFNFEDNRNSIRKVLGVFTIALHLRDRHVFMWQLVEILNVFYTLTLKQIFCKTKIFFKKLESCFLVESTKIENVSFSYKTAISEANVKTNRMVSTK